MTSSFTRGARLVLWCCCLALLVTVTPGSAVASDPPEPAAPAARVDPLVDKTPSTPPHADEHVLTPWGSTDTEGWSAPASAVPTTPARAQAPRPAPRKDNGPAFEPIIIKVPRRAVVRQRVEVSTPVVQPLSRQGRSRLRLASRGGHAPAALAYARPEVATHVRYRSVVVREMAALDIAPIILRYAQKHRVDPYLIKAVIAVESRFRPHAVSCAGARGLMQLMPATGYSMGARDLHDPEQNIAAGTKYLRAMLDRYEGRQELAIAAYNAGPGNVSLRGGIPNISETRRYVVKVRSAYRAYAPAPGATAASRRPAAPETASTTPPDVSGGDASDGPRISFPRKGP